MQFPRTIPINDAARALAVHPKTIQWLLNLETYGKSEMVNQAREGHAVGYCFHY